MDSSNRPTQVPLHQIAKERYMHYAMSVVMSRALPDVRDGLKPVQRRILYSMYQLKLRASANYRKSAQVVGEVMGKYHPHGDSAIYDAMVRMAQPFALRYPLVDGQGNFGSIDGDRAAAMRYTEAKLTLMGESLLRDLEAVPLWKNYDGSRLEPQILPAPIPLLLLNGSTGIAVGMATHIPPHHLGELLRATIALIHQPDLSVRELLEILPGPDFPTGGWISNDALSMAEIYQKGQGTLELLASYHIESHGRVRSIVFDAIPYEVNKAQLIEKIAEHIEAQKVPQIIDLRDESTQKVRIVLVLRAKADPEAAIAYLYKHTPLKSRFHVNMTALFPRDLSLNLSPEPKRSGIIPMLKAFLEFRFEVVRQRLLLELQKLEARLHILEALRLITRKPRAFLTLLARVKDKEEAIQAIFQNFDLDRAQALAILGMPLQSVIRLERKKLESEFKQKSRQAQRLKLQLADPQALWRLIEWELRDWIDRFEDSRRTQMGTPSALLKTYQEEDYIVEQDVFALISEKGWIKRQGSFKEVSSIRVKSGDRIRWIVQGSTRKSIVFLTDRGKAYTLRMGDLTQTRGYGEPIQAKFQFEDGESLVGVVTDDPRPYGQKEDSEAQLLVLSIKGFGLRLPLENFSTPSGSHGRRLMRLRPDDRVLLAERIVEPSWVCMATHHARALTLPVEAFPLLKGSGKGSKMLTLLHGDTLMGAVWTWRKDFGLEVHTQRGKVIVIHPQKYKPVRKGAMGRLVLKKEKLSLAPSGSTPILRSFENPIQPLEVCKPLSDHCDDAQVQISIYTSPSDAQGH